ncbi:MAG: ABC-2 family transporter protein [Polyangiales bacterium]
MIAPYFAPFAARFQLTLQYRAAALAGFVTQCWWGALKIMVLAAFYGDSDAPLSLPQTISYIWLVQGLLALSYWSADPELIHGVRTGAIAHDRLRPVDTYWYWYARVAAWIMARAIPRLGLMVLMAGLALPACGYAEWSLRPPASDASMLFLVAISIGALNSAAMLALVGAGVVATGNERGVGAFFGALVLLLSGNEIPLRLFPDWAHTFLALQPFASILDAPLRIYVGDLSGAAALRAIALQVFWLVALVLLGRLATARSLAKLEVQGG